VVLPDEAQATFLLEAARRDADAGDMLAAAMTYAQLDAMLSAGGPLPRPWAYREEVIDVMPDGVTPKTTRRIPLRVPAALRVPGKGGH